MALCHMSSIVWTESKLHFPPFLTTNDNHHHHHRHHFRGGAHPRRGCSSTTFVCFAKKPRIGRKVKLAKPNMSDTELCNELREFAAEEGLPEDKIPSMAELSKRGRKDLANIVQRKGYKVVTELIRNQAINKIQSINEEPPMKQSNDEIQTKRNEKLLMSQASEKIWLERNKMAPVNLTSNEIQLERQDMLLENNRNEEIPSEGNTELLNNLTNCKVQLNGELLDGQTENKFNSEGNLLENQDLANDQLESSGSMVPQEVILSSAEQFPNSRCNVSANEVPQADVDIISEVGKLDEETEICCLKTMMHLKEEELLLLEQEIEKEKQALSTLQKRATDEIRKVQGIVLAKDSALRAAEEALLGLKEVLIEYHGPGQYVEVSGSFNGWHHRLKMDHHSSSNALDSSERRESNCWTTTLWLYPGVYEIKFIVDGDWRVDSQREMLTKGYITNNILRVER